ncbi:anthrone oxygenase family protein [Larkinella soli]|uniref:anthrone oxygenase family protein n=1 Tax=Larkinella soli TaxID=1770527 RepID=UPI000FFB3D57|nr:anthrone oxygenase family protein [Larkinella soli]
MFHFTITDVVVLSAAVATGLMAGLFYAYSFSVSPGLARVSDAAYLAAMQAINRAILNPVFFAGFLGALVLLPLSTWLQYGQPVSARFWLLLGAAVVYTVGVFGVTGLGNVPLNDALEAFDLSSATADELAAMRTRFESPWNRLNAVRTLSAVLSELLVTAALLSPKPL